MENTTQGDGLNIDKGDAQRGAQMIPSPTVDFSVQDGSRFEGDFFIQVNQAENYIVSREEQAFLDRIAYLTHAADVPIGSDDRASDRIAIRKRLMRSLRQCAKDFAEASRGSQRDKKAEALVIETYKIEGFHQEWTHRIERNPFSVLTVPSADDLKKDPSKLVTDITIIVRDIEVSPDKQKFKLELDQAVRVVQAALKDVEYSSAEKQRSPERLDKYLRKLYGIARIGLENQARSHAFYASEALESFRQEFLAHEGSYIKNAYIKKLAHVSACFTLISILLYFFLEISPKDWLLHDVRFFLLLLAGSSLGTLISFSIRRERLTFTDLGLLEEDRLSPLWRMTISSGLAFVVGLMLWTGMVTVSFGSNPQLMAAPGSALLIGFLCGIAERTLSGVVGQKASGVISSIGSTSSGQR